MGSSESKLSACAPIKPEPAIKNISHLVDPRSPSVGIDRTPIQVGGFVSKNGAEVKSECPRALTDPRSPTVGITRTPVRDVMRATVGSFARRLGMLFHSETEGRVPETPQRRFSDAVEEVAKSDELPVTQPLLCHQPCYTFGSMADHPHLLDTAVMPRVQSAGDVSPFLLLEEPQLEVELETEADISLEEAEEAKESPLNNRLSMSLITCHEGAPSSQIFADVHCDGSSFQEPSVEAELQGEGVDHSYALRFVTDEIKTAAESSQPTDTDLPPAQVSHVVSEEAKEIESSEESKDVDKEMSLPSVPALLEPAASLSPEQPQLSTKIPCLTLDPKSPSQVVFKPQWLGKGFGTNGLRAKSVQRHYGKGGSSPLAVHVAVKNVSNENRGQAGKRKQKGTEGRSPLQILKETNSPMNQRSQMKLKVSTPDKQRLGQMDSRRLALSLDKENR